MMTSISRRLPFRGIFAVFAALLLSVGLAAQTIQLRGGRVLLGSIEEVYPEGLTVRRLDTGGVLELRWDHLTPDAARTIKKRAGILVEESAEIQVEALQVKYKAVGGRPITVTGRRVGNRDNKLLLRVNGNDLPIDQRNIVSVTPVQVPVSLVYTPQEYYDYLLSNDPPGENPDKHALLGELLMRLRDYDRAQYHLERAQEVGGGLNSAKIDGLLERLALYKAAAQERELLDNIQIARARGRERDFQKGRELIAEFEDSYPDSKLQAEFEEEKTRFEMARTRFLTSAVDRRWKAAIRFVAKQYISKTKPSLAQVQAYGEEKMSQAILARVAEQLQLEEEEVSRLFAERTKLARVSTDLYRYGIGSWVLGEAAIREGVDQKGADEASSTEQDDQIRRLAEKIREARKRAKQAQQGAQDDGDPQENWWKGLPLGEKAGWLRAYYAEKSGDLEIVRAKNAPCSLCAGRGWIEVVGSTGDAARETCPQCRGTKLTRSFTAR